MAIHPAATALLTVAEAEHLSVVSAAAHSLAMVSVLLLFLGACGLQRHIAAADRISFAAIVTYGFACVAVLIAAAVSGFIVPNIMKHMIHDALLPGISGRSSSTAFFKSIKPSRVFFPLLPLSQSFSGLSPRCATEDSGVLSLFMGAL